VAHLLVIGDRNALAWVLAEQRMAFPGHRRREVAALAPGDRLFIYTTRGCFGNPTRGRGRVIGVAKALDAPGELPEPVALAGRQFELGCGIELGRIAPYGYGVELAPLVPNLSTFPNKHGWMTQIRRPLLPLTPEDSTLVARLLRAVSRPPAEAVDSYLTRAPRRAG
jgi:hypothetical protein